VGKIYYEKNALILSAIGAVTGIANGLFGSGGGIIAVPMLKKSGFETKKAHACSLAVTLPLSAVSAVLYYDTVPWNQTLLYIPFGLAGAAIGVTVMKKISPKWLSRIFGILLIAAGVRSLLQ